MSYKIGVDVGGTFTDVCMFNQDTGEVNVYKLPSTPWDPSEAIGNGIQEILELYHVSPAAVSNLVHGTTVATNAALERKGAKTAIITTKGFRDLIELARQTRASLYDTQVEKPVPIVYRKMRREVDERVQADGLGGVPRSGGELVDIYLTGVLVKHTDVGKGPAYINANFVTHTFIFYFACLSGITPPVALAAYTGAGIAGSKAIQTASEGCKLAIVAFFVPYMFVYNTAFLMAGGLPEILWAVLCGIVMCYALTAAIQGYMVKRLNPLWRLSFAACAVFMFLQFKICDVIGLVLFTVLIALLLLGKRKDKQTEQFV